MKKGVELRKIVTLLNWNDIVDLLPSDEANDFIMEYTPTDECYIHFEFTPYNSEFEPTFPELEKVLEKTLEVCRSEMILIKFNFQECGYEFTS